MFNSKFIGALVLSRKVRGVLVSLVGQFINDVTQGGGGGKANVMVGYKA